MNGFQAFPLLVIGAVAGFVAGVYFTVGTSRFQARLTRIQTNRAALKAAQDAVASLKAATAKAHQ